MSHLLKTSQCTREEHGICDGTIKENDEITNFCDCPCHNSTFHLVRNLIGLSKVTDQ
jgi:hypothetical protein